jgi:HSP20 family protein
MATQYNPFEDVERFFDRMGDQFEEMAGDWDGGDQVDRLTAAFEPMAVDIVEQDEQFILTADLPGFERDDIEVRLTDDRLHIEANREEETEEEEETSRRIRRERHHRSMKRSIRLPSSIDSENTEARMNRGVLTVTLPKQSSGSGHSIEIE